MLLDHIFLAFDIMVRDAEVLKVETVANIYSAHSPLARLEGAIFSFILRAEVSMAETRVLPDYICT